MINTKSQARTWLGTYNNPKDSQFAEEYLERWTQQGGAKYATGQLERGAEGTLHIQFYLNFKSPVRLSKIKKYCSHSHFEPVKIDNGAHDYVHKLDTRVDGPWSFGERPVQRNSKEDWDKVKKDAIAGKLDDIPAEIFVRHYRNLKEIKKDYMTHEAMETDCRWYYGPSGAGKSRKAWEEFPNAFPKQVNKWWDGYQSHPEVIMDDMDPYNKALGGDLKRWADRYKVTGETKGGAIPLMIKVFIITSQYSPEQIWEDHETISAIRRRFKVTKFINGFQGIEDNGAGSAV